MNQKSDEPNLYRIDMVVSSNLDKEDFEANLLNCLTIGERKKGLVTGMLRMKTEIEDWRDWRRQSFS